MKKQKKIRTFLVLLFFTVMCNSNVDGQTYSAKLVQKHTKERGAANYLLLKRNAVLFETLPVISNPAYLSYCFIGDLFFKVEGFSQRNQTIFFTIGKYKVLKKEIKLLEAENISSPFFGIRDYLSVFLIKTDQQKLKLVMKNSSQEETINLWEGSFLTMDSFAMEKVKNRMDSCIKYRNNYLVK